MALKSFVSLVTLLVLCITAFYFLRQKPTPDLPTPARMVESRYASIKSFPHHVQYGPQCNGAIITEWWMIAPAHCPEYDYVRVGSSYRDYGKIKTIKERIVHPEFKNPNNSHMFEYDFQLMKFQEKITFRDCAEPIALSFTPKERLDRLSWFTVSGFGEVYENGPLSTDLRFIRIRKQKDSSCAGPAHSLWNRNISENLVCAGMDIGRVDACRSDVGGGMVYEGSLLGLLLNGQGCLMPEEKLITTGRGIDKRRHSLYGLLWPVMDWINNVTNHDVIYKVPPTRFWMMV